MRRIVITGTGTDVGKTWTTCQIAHALTSRDIAVCAHKVCESFDPHLGEADSVVLGRETGQLPRAICAPEWSYPIAMAPPLAARHLGRTAPSIAELSATIMSCAERESVHLIESVGGVRSPLASDGDTIDLIRLMLPDLVVVVSTSGLGAINSVRLTLDALADAPACVFLNRFDEHDEVHLANFAWFRDSGIRVEAKIEDLVATLGLLVLS